MGVPTSRGDLDTTPNMNYPAANDPAKNNVDDLFRALSAFIAQNYGDIQTNANTIANKAAKGANEDITSLAGLTTALSISQGGTAATTASAAREALGIDMQSPDVASDTTVDLDAMTGHYGHVTGTVSVSAITLAQGAERTVVFDDGGGDIIYSSSLLTITGADIETEAGDIAVFRGEASGVVRMVDYVRASGAALVVSSVSYSAPVRQTVLSGPVDSSGFAAFGGSTGSTTVTANGTLSVTSSYDTEDLLGSITDPSWTGLSTDGTMYLGLTIAEDGTCTPFSTTLAPTYQWGGTYSTTNGQRTFNIQEMTMKVGDGSAAAQAYDVFVGEVTVSSNVVSAITWYALKGQYDSGYTSTLPGVSTSVSKNHNLGVMPEFFDVDYKCLTTDLGYSVGQIMRNANTSDTTPLTLKLRATETTVGFTTANSVAFYFQNTGGANAAPTAAYWAYRFLVKRGW